MKHWIEAIEQVTDALDKLKMNGTAVDNLKETLKEMKAAEVWLLPPWSELEHPIITIDFDGVLCEYKGGWKGAADIFDEKPVAGAIAWLEKCTEQFTVLIFSSRCNDKDGIAAIDKWLKLYGLSDTARTSLSFQPGKPSAFIMIDDRAIQFEGEWANVPLPVDLREFFKPWYYDKGVGWREAQKHSHEQHEVDQEACPHGQPWDDCPDCRH